MEDGTYVLLYKNNAGFFVGTASSPGSVAVERLKNFGIGLLALTLRDFTAAEQNCTNAAPRLAGEAAIEAWRRLQRSSCRSASPIDNSTRKYVCITSGQQRFASKPV